MKVAAWQYPIERHATFAAWRDKLFAGIARAAAGGAGLCVLPEYASMELTALLAPDEQATLPAQLAAVQRLLPDYDAACRDAAVAHGLAIVAASFPVRRPDGHYRNRLLVIGPSGETMPIEKLQMTRFETEIWGISAGKA